MLLKMRSTENLETCTLSWLCSPDPNGESEMLEELVLFSSKGICTLSAAVVLLCASDRDVSDGDLWYNCGGGT